eukprot:COSAG02_NODE_367_length_23739_cov_16.775127_17_plen_172_part_00
MCAGNTAIGGGAEDGQVQGSGGSFQFDGMDLCCTNACQLCHGSPAVACPGECPIGTYGAEGSTSLESCGACPAGTIDHDRDPSSQCLSCMPGRFSNHTGLVLLNHTEDVQTDWIVGCADPASAPPPPPELNACSGTGIELVDAGHMRLTSMQNNQHCTWTMTCSEPTHAPQ